MKNLLITVCFILITSPGLSGTWIDDFSSFDYVYVSNGIPGPLTPHGKLSVSWGKMKAGD